MAYYKIADLVDEVNSGEIPNKMHIKDGSPLIVEEPEEGFKSRGHKIRFIEGCEKKAYERISKTQLGNVYHWGTIAIDGKDHNILYGESTDGTFVNVDKDKKYLDTFDGSKDPFFTDALRFIENELKQLKKDDDEYAVFKMQMYYMLLWSAVDRYCTLKYYICRRQGYYLEKLSEDELFIEALNNVNPRTLDDVHSARNGTPFHFYRDRPMFIVNSYYTVRSNVVHRGKEPENNMELLITSLEDMLKIFDYIIKKTFKNEDKS